MDPLRLLDLHDPHADAPRAFRDGVAGFVGSRPELAPVAREALRGLARTAASPAKGEAARAVASLMEGVIQAHASLPRDWHEAWRGPVETWDFRPRAPGPRPRRPQAATSPRPLSSASTPGIRPRKAR